MENLLRLLSLNAARLIFVGSLLVALYVGLNWALDIEARPDATSLAAERAAAEASASEDAAAAATPTPTPTAASATPTAPPTVDPEELIAAAAPPAETSVQVLDAGGGQARVDAVVSALEQIGYDIVARQSSSRDVERTTVYFTDGNQPQAEGLRARDPRFQVVEANQGLSDGVDIHVLVGPDF
ncbi:LytR C-terminal domain-containing protein [Euzebya sp.]|uniref:LytR C-terminal domain-containing protein n=1 Tax=Euzebya sp. TaxID=1971409 RepID=UPI0035155386